MGTQYVALLRGINVGGNNIIPMAELRECVIALGAKDVATYIQSGNVLFDGGRRSAGTWTGLLERGLAERFDYSARLMLRTHEQLRAIVTDAPAGFGDAPDAYRYDVLFLSDALPARDAFAQLEARPGVDEANAGDGVIYFSRLIARASQSWLNKLVSRPMYKEMTVRNWRTTTTLLRKLDDRVSA